MASPAGTGARLSAGLSRRHLLRTAGALAVASAGALPAACSGAPESNEDPGTFTIYWNAGHAYKTYDSACPPFGPAAGRPRSAQLPGQAGPFRSSGSWGEGMSFTGGFFRGT